VIYDIILHAANEGRVCPNYLDLNEVAGFESSSTSPSIVKRLERKGLITVKRYQRFREVTIIATGKTTARSPHQHVDHPHVPRGMRKVEGTPIMTDGRTYSIKTGNG
jgi:hypothetical protein